MLWCSQLNDVLLSTNWMCRLRGVWDWDSGQRLPAWRYLSNLWMLSKHSMHFSTFSYVWAWCFLVIISLSLWISKCMPNDCKRSRAVDAFAEKKVQLFIQAPIRAVWIQWSCSDLGIHICPEWSDSSWTAFSTGVKTTKNALRANSRSNHSDHIQGHIA